MEKTIRLGKTPVKLSNSVEWLLIYREQFGKDILPNLIPIANTAVELAVSLMKATGGQSLEKENVTKVLQEIDIADVQSAMYSLAGLEFADIINITWAMAKAADDEIDEPRVWVKSLDGFPLDVVLPVLFDMNVQAFLTTKNSKRLRSAVEVLKPKKTDSTSTES